MRQFVFAKGYNESLTAATAGQISIVESASSKDILNLVLKRNADKGGNMSFPIFKKAFSYVKAVYNSSDETKFAQSFTIPEVVPYADYTVVFVQKGKLFNERSKWSATVRSLPSDTATTIGDKIVKYVKDNKDTLGLTAENAAGTVTVTGVKTGDDFAIVFADELLGLASEPTTKGKRAIMNAEMLKDLHKKAMADAGFEYTYDDLDIYPGAEFNPLASPDATDTGFMVYTLRFAEPRVSGTQSKDIYQIIQVAFPTGTNITAFETKLNTLKTA